MTDRPIAAALPQPEFYAITPVLRAEDDEALWWRQVEAQLEGGPGRLLLRLPGLQPQRRARLAGLLAPRCASAGIELLVHGDAALAAALDLGLHLPAARLAEADGLRALWRHLRGRALAASCHDAGELALAWRLGFDFAVLGPVAETASHPGRPGMGWAAFQTLRASVPELPVYALGGLGRGDLALALAHGAQGVAAIRGLGAAAAA